MKKLLIFSLVLLVFQPVVAADFGDSEVNRIHQSILDERGLPLKIRQGRILGSMGTPQARAALLNLLDEWSYWDRDAAVAGLFFFSDETVCKTLISRFVSDHMIDTTIKEGVLNNWDTFYKIVEQAYTGEPDERNRLKLLELIQASRSDAGDTFLKSIVKDKSSLDRNAALELLAQSTHPSTDGFIRSVISDNTMKPSVMDYLLKHGTSDDLKLFLPYLNPWQEALTEKAYAAVNLWAESGTKEKLFYEALVSRDRKLTYTALSSFEKVKSERLLTRLCDIAEHDTFQEFRRLACLNLIHFNDPHIIPVLDAFLKESYTPEKQDGWDAFITSITLGTTAIFKYFDQRRQEKRFDASQQKIAMKVEMLKEITGN